MSKKDQQPKIKRFIFPWRSLWERYFFREILKVFFLFLICFYGLYILIDFSNFSYTFYRQPDFHWKELVKYYLFDFVKRMDVLMPFAIIIATIKTLCNLNIHHELLALLASGISLRRLLRPFVLFGLFCTGLVYLNTEFVLPSALKNIKLIDTFRSRTKNKESPAVQHVVLEDESVIVFKEYDSAKERFLDAYWILSIDEIYRMKYLYPFEETPLGKHVVHFKRNPQGQLALQEMEENQLFSDIHFNNQTLTDTLSLPQELSMSDLHHKKPSHSHIPSEKESQILAAFYYKLAMPWLCLLAVIGPAVSCLRFTRLLPVFFIYSGSIFGLVGFYLIMNAALILGSRHVIDPSLAIFVPFSLVMGFFGLRYATRL
jgi:lipopolysaccharide export system permease protein